MSALPKFTAPDFDLSVEFTHQNIWQREEYPGWSRLLIGSKDGEIPLILELCRTLPGPFGLLYVLIASRLGREEGRYQHPDSLGYGDLEQFLLNFRAFFEQDGRHHLWVSSLDGEGQFIFDRHNMIYAYGDLDRYESLLRERGFSRGAISIPAPHAHHYHAEFDHSEDELMACAEWIRFPLQPTDDL